MNIFLLTYHWSDLLLVSATMGKNDTTMETRTQSRLNGHDEHIDIISTQLEALHHTQERHYSTLQETLEKFQAMVLQWMKCMEKQPMIGEENQSPENSSMIPNSSTPSPHSHVVGHSCTPILPIPITGHHPHEFGRPFQFHDALLITKKVRLPTFSGTDPRDGLPKPKHISTS